MTEPPPALGVALNVAEPPPNVIGLGFAKRLSVRDAGLTTTGTLLEVAALYFCVCATLALTMQVPAPVGVRVEPDSVHGPDTNAYETAPSPALGVAKSVTAPAPNAIDEGEAKRFSVLSARLTFTVTLPDVAAA